MTAAMCVAGVLVLAAAGGLVFVKHRIDTYVDPYVAKVAQAGYVQKRAQVNDVDFSYVEGPDNGPPLVLLHAQLMDWFDYSRVLPELATKFHVFDIDYPGHGDTTQPDDYPMTAAQIGSDLGDFIDDVIGQAAYVTGNSSGGLLTTWLAANRPASVRAAVLEDPPLFASEYPRIEQTIAYRAFRTSSEAVRDGYDGDFLSYWIEHSSTFFDNYVFKGAGTVLDQAVRQFRRSHPAGTPVDLGVLPNDTVRLLLRGLSEYDPRFGAAFYDGSWNAGFDHAEALARIDCPVLLIQANFEVRDDGILDGAMSQEEGERAASLLKNGTYERVDATHVVHLDKPDVWLGLVENFFLGS